MQLGIRALELSKRLVKKDIYPIILSKKIDLKQIKNKDLIKEIPESLTIYRTIFLKIKLKRFLIFLNYFFRFDFYVEWIPFAYNKAKKVIKRNRDIKFIYAAGPPFYSFIIGYLLNRKFKIPLVVEYGDPWSHNPYYDKKPIINKKIDLILEKKILESSHIIVSLSDVMNSFLKEKFQLKKNKKMVVIDHGLSLDENRNLMQKKSEKIIITFAGNIYGKRNILPLLKIISELNKEKFFEDIKLLIKIYGKYPKIQLLRKIAELNITDLIFPCDFISREKVMDEILNCDLALHIGENLNYPTLSFKIWDYLRFRKKIIYLGREDSYTAEFLNQNNLGIVIPINNFIKGKEKFKSLLNDIKNNTFDFKFDEIRLKDFSWDNKVIKFMEKIVQNFK